MSRRTRVLLGICMAVLALASAAVVLTRDDDDAKARNEPAITLDRSGNRNYQDLITRVGKPVSIVVNDARNESPRPVKLVSYRARSVPDGLRFIGAGVLDESRPYSLGGDLGYPPETEGFGEHFHELAGFELAPFRPRQDRGTQLVLGFEPLRRGYFAMPDGLELTYVQDGRRQVARSANGVGVCVLSPEEYRNEPPDLYEPGGLCHYDVE